MKTASAFLGVALAAIVATAPLATAQEVRMRAIGELVYEPEPVPPQTGVFAVDRSARLVRSLRLEADGGTANIKELTLIYRDGGERRVPINQRIRDGEQTSSIRLQEVRPIKEVEVVYTPSGPMRLILNADARAPEPPPPPPPQWVNIGCKNVGFLIDKDSLRVSAQDPFVALRFSVNGYDVQLNDLGVTYSNGAQERYRVNAVIPSGGRTNAIQLYHKAKNGTVIRYIDICSLYPYINKYFKYPILHPVIYVGDECPPLDRLEGLVLCTVLPPRNLFHPVLPARINNKLLFTLCTTCAEEKWVGDCAHTDQERSMTGTWVSDEIKKAVSLGYTMLTIHEAWHYETMQYNKDKGTEGLFTTYINTHLKRKVEASGWPCHILPNDKIAQQKYVDDYLEHEGIQLDLNNIRKNEGIRSLAKLMLNSLWGKFGERENRPQTTVFYTHDEIIKHVCHPNIEAMSFTLIDDDAILLTWRYIHEANPTNKHANVVIAAYTTAQARLHLYSYLEKLGKRVLYMDTDSVIFTEHPSDAYKPKTGIYLGDMTDELEHHGPGTSIDEFVSGGPKNYAYSTVTPNSDEKHVIIKVKGMSINAANKHLLSFQKLKEMVVDGTDPVVVTYPHKIHRTKAHEVFSKQMSKTYKVVYDKRQIVNGTFETLPYGFQ